MIGFAPISHPSCEINIPGGGRCGLVVSRGKLLRRPGAFGTIGRRYSGERFSFTCPLPTCKITVFACWFFKVVSKCVWVSREVVIENVLFV